MDVFEPTLAQAATFLRSQQHGVISSLEPDGQVRLALVGFSSDDRLSVMFGTDEISRKSVNLERDPHVTLLVTDVYLRYQLQLQGEARPVTEAEYAARRDEHYAKSPGSLRFENEPGQVFYVITPSQAWFSDFNPEHSRDWKVTSLALG